VISSFSLRSRMVRTSKYKADGNGEWVGVYANEESKESIQVISRSIRVFFPQLYACSGAIGWSKSGWTLYSIYLFFDWVFLRLNSRFAQY